MYSLMPKKAINSYSGATPGLFVLVVEGLPCIIVQREDDRSEVGKEFVAEA